MEHFFAGKLVLFTGFTVVMSGLLICSSVQNDPVNSMVTREVMGLETH